MDHSSSDVGSFERDLRVNWKRFSDLNLEWPQWLVKGLLPRNSLICLYGQRGQGKTFLALDWACSIATGAKWLEFEVPTNAAHARPRVAYLLAERPDGLMRRLHGWLKLRHGTADPESASAKGAEILDGTYDHFYFAETPALIDIRAERKALVHSLKRIAPLDLLILDPMVSFMDGAENEARDMQRFIHGIRHISEELNCSVLLVHHEGKRHGSGARGSSALEAGMDTIIRMTGENQYQSVLEVTKQRDAAALAPFKIVLKELSYGEEQPLGKFPFRCTFNRPASKTAQAFSTPSLSGPGTRDHQSRGNLSKKAIELMGRRDACLQAIRYLDDPATIDQILDRMVQQGLQLSRSTLYATLNDLRESALISQSRVGKKFTYSAVHAALADVSA